MLPFFLIERRLDNGSRKKSTYSESSGPTIKKALRERDGKEEENHPHIRDVDRTGEDDDNERDQGNEGDLLYKRGNA